jgi:hypothetical protein
MRRSCRRGVLFAENGALMYRGLRGNSDGNRPGLGDVTFIKEMLEMSGQSNTSSSQSAFWSFK